MKTTDIALLLLLAGSGLTLATGALGAPVSALPRATAAERGVILVSDCETDEAGNTYCSGDAEQPQEPEYEQPRDRGPSKTQQLLNALKEAAEQAAAEKRERDRQNAIRAEETRQLKAAEKERERKKAAEAKERKRIEAAAKKKREQKQAEDAERDRKRRQAEADKAKDKAAADKAAADKTAADKAKADAEKSAADDKATDDKPSTADATPICDGKTCEGGEYLDGDCRCAKGTEGGTTEGTTLEGNPGTVVVGPTDEFPPPSTIPDSICQLKIGNTTIFCDGYLPGLPPTTTSCRGRTEKGCYLRPVTISKLDGESGTACMQFCITKRPPVVVRTEPPAPPKDPPVVDKTPGTTAVPTGTATIYREPQRPKTPAVKTATATTYVQPKLAPTPAVKTATAATYVQPKPGPTPAVKTATAATYVEPSPRP